MTMIIPVAEPGTHANTIEMIKTRYEIAKDIPNAAEKTFATGISVCRL